MNDPFQHLAGLGAFKAWLAEHLPLFQENSPLAPPAIVLTPAEIHTAYTRAMRTSLPHSPAERHLLHAIAAIQPLANSRYQDLKRLTYWTRRCAIPARGE